MERTFTCNLCDALCGLSVEVDGARIGKIRGNPDDVFSRGHICPKAIGLGELWSDPDRVRAPLRRVGTRWERCTWNDALDDIAARLGAIQRRHGRDAVGVYIGNPVVHAHRSGLASQLLTAAIGTKNRFDPNSQDGNPRLFACMQVYGDALTIPVPDVERTDYLLILGANPAASNGSQLGLGDVRARMKGIRERGGKVVLVDPRRTETAAWADRHVFIRPGGDGALLLAMMNVLFAERAIDVRAVSQIAHGIGELRAIAERFTPERVEGAIGVDAAMIRTLARELSGAKRKAVYARVGVCVSEFGPLASWLVEAINVCIGSFDREGGVMLPTPAADIGPLGRLAVENASGRWTSRVRGLPEYLGSLPSSVMAEEMETPGPGQIRALVTMAGNPVLSTPNGERLARALSGLELVVGIDYYLNETLAHAHYVLPPRHVFETGNYDLILSRFAVRNHAKYSAPIATSDDDTKDDWEIATELALRLRTPDVAGLRSLLRRGARRLPEQLVDLLLRVGPHGLSLAALEAQPHGVDLGPLVRRGPVPTEDGLVRLAPHALTADVPRLERWVDAPRAPGLVMIGRRHLRSNNTWNHNLPTLAKGPDRARLMVSPLDAAARGLVNGAKVRVRSRTGEVEVAIEITGDVMPGVVSLPHGFGHQIAGSALSVASKLEGPSANALTDDQRVEPVLGTSILNGVPVEVFAITEEPS
jgi:anaerobic selenocysteine-containing dehydrogenase